jgi:hypothetical protein
MIPRLCAIIALITALAACGQRQPDVKTELARLTQDMRGHVPPLPEFPPSALAVVRADVDSLPDPFYPHVQNDRRGHGHSITEK